jgi:hypothetical protein
MNKNIEIVLTKDQYGVTASNKTKGVIDYFDDSDEGRKAFVQFMISEFINQEVENGAKYR